MEINNDEVETVEGIPITFYEEGARFFRVTPCPNGNFNFGDYSFSVVSKEILYSIKNPYSKLLPTLHAQCLYDISYPTLRPRLGIDDEGWIRKPSKIIEEYTKEDFIKVWLDIPARIKRINTIHSLMGK